MKANVPKSWTTLPEKEQKAIHTFLEEKTLKRLQYEEAYIQKTWLKMSCIILHDVHGFGEARLMQYLAQWKRMYNTIGNCTTNKEVQQNLDDKLNKIFKNGYPERWINTL